MNADEYWIAVIRRNPALDKEDNMTVTLTIRRLRNLIKQAHETGWKHHEAIRKKTDELFGKNNSNPFPFF